MLQDRATADLTFCEYATNVAYVVLGVFSSLHPRRAHHPTAPLFTTAFSILKAVHLEVSMQYFLHCARVPLLLPRLGQSESEKILALITHLEGVGANVGISVGAMVGTADGSAVGSVVGSTVGCSVGDCEGSVVGSSVGETEGSAVGVLVDGVLLGRGVGKIVGLSVGAAVGISVGDVVGTSLGSSAWIANSSIGIHVRGSL